MNEKAVACEVDPHEIINTSMTELLRTGMENENQTSRCLWCEQKKNKTCFSPAMRKISPFMSQWSVDIFRNAATCESKLPKKNPQVFVCHWKIGKTDQLMTYSALSMTHERWMCARMYEGLYSIYKEWKELFHSSQLACSILHIWNKTNTCIFSPKSNGKYKWWYVNIRINIHFFQPSPQVHISPPGCLSDDWKIRNISTGFPESPVLWKQQPITELLTLESVTHWISYLPPRCGSKTCWTSATYTQMKAAEGWTVRVTLIIDWLVGREKHQSSAAPSEAPSVSLWRVSAFSSSALRAWG